jgi:hypothetical protein
VTWWLLLAGLILRVMVNDVAQYSPADESTYVFQVNMVLTGQYPELIRRYLETPALHDYPTPTRWGYLGLASAWCRFVYPQRYGVPEVCDAHALAALSTFASCVALVLTWLLARLLIPESTTYALALAAVSPLQLLLGRRALSDEVVCMLGLAVAVCGVLAWRRRWQWGILAAICLLWLVATKEWYWVVGLPVLPVYWLLTGYFSGDYTALERVVPILWAQSHTPYSLAYQSGWWHRPLVDFALVSPGVLVLAIAALARLPDVRRRGREPLPCGHRPVVAEQNLDGTPAGLRRQKVPNRRGQHRKFPRE